MGGVYSVANDRAREQAEDNLNDSETTEQVAQGTPRSYRSWPGTRSHQRHNRVASVVSIILQHLRDFFAHYDSSK